jgi:ABC-type multidrug transport system ATPase subunit
MASPMTQPQAPTITVCSGDVRRTFPPDRDVVVGRDVRADLRISHPAISRAHVILRCVDGHWIATDNKSLNGMFVGKQKVKSAPVGDGNPIYLGDPDGPRLTFELGSPAARPSTTRIKLPASGGSESNDAVGGFRGRWRADPALSAITIGRVPDNDIVVPDLLTSSRHAKLVSTSAGIQIQDAGSINGTFVNGERVKEATLRENDVVTIGTVDLVFADGNLVPRTEPAATTGGLEVRGVGVTLTHGGLTLLDGVSFTARPSTLTAVIGPSGSGKSTLLNTLVGVLKPTSGAVSFDGRDLHAEYASLRSRIGIVPQDDVLHDRLTVTQALSIAAELRMPPDTTKQDWHQAISRVLQELEMTEHADKRVDQLSGGQRKRVSVAMELLTEPTLLVLDEPTTGLDPALDRLVMAMLRRLADAGRVMVVVTHSLAFLDVCDQVLLLAPGGKTAYCGPPSELGPVMGSTDWAEIFNRISADPDRAHQRFLEHRGPMAEPVAQPAPEQSANVGNPPRTNFWHEFSAISRRQAQLLFATRRYVVFLVVLPLLVGLLPLTVGGDAGFTKPPADSSAPLEPRQLIVLLSFAAILMGLTLTVRDLIAERAIYRHEQAAGLSPSAYLLAKICVFGAVAVIQSALLVLMVTAPIVGKRAPSSAVVLGSPMLELFVDVAATCVVAMILGLVISAISRSSNQYIPLLAVTCMAQLVLAGSFVPITGRPALEAIAAFTPARWGVAAMASSVDLTNLVEVDLDPHWKHTISAWLFDIAMLGVLALLFAGFVRWRLRLNAKA